MSKQKMVEYTPEKRDRLRKAYDKARSYGHGTFSFDGHTYLTDYAKYLLEYLDDQFADARRSK